MKRMVAWQSAMLLHCRVRATTQCRAPWCVRTSPLRTGALALLAACWSFSGQTCACVSSSKATVGHWCVSLRWCAISPRLRLAAVHVTPCHGMLMAWHGDGAGALRRHHACPGPGLRAWARPPLRHGGRKARSGSGCGGAPPPQLPRGGRSRAVGRRGWPRRTRGSFTLVPFILAAIAMEHLREGCRARARVWVAWSGERDPALGRRGDSGRLPAGSYGSCGVVGCSQVGPVLAPVSWKMVFAPGPLHDIVLAFWIALTSLESEQSRAQRKAEVAGDTRMAKAQAMICLGSAPSQHGMHGINAACLALPCLALPCLALPCLALPCLAML
jgi:hypothetical protein